MMPAVCAVCGGTEACDAVRFADYEPLPAGAMGHPRGLVWLCAVHLPRGRTLTHLPASAAVAKLRPRGGIGGLVDRLLGR